MRRYRVSPEAKQDLREIRDDIARDSIAASRRVLTNLRDAFDQLGRMPSQGHKREDLTNKPVVFWPMGSYLIVYNAQSRPIQIVRVLHGARDAPRMI